MDAFDPSPISLLDRERIVAKPGFNRWLVPPAALAIHLCIGMAYGFSVFWLPLSRALGISKSVVCKDMTLIDALTTTSCDWRVSDVTVMYTLFFVFLGSSAAVFGGWLERAGPRKAGVAAALCWCVGLVISALGVFTHQLWLMWIGSGAIGGIGLGLGYISPVSTLIKWFPDRRGMATGMAIMGFGGGAMIASPLSAQLMAMFDTAYNPDNTESVAEPSAVAAMFVILGVVYLCFMMFGAFTVRVPPEGWRPEGYEPAQEAEQKLVTTGGVSADNAIKTPQFWLLWTVLFCNVTAGIGILEQASPMIQDHFSTVTAAAAAGFVGLLSLCNMGGRLGWSSTSDVIGRKPMYMIFLGGGAVLYFLLASTGTAAVIWFVLLTGVILSFYGGGFATVPAYLKDLFGTLQVGAIHGRLLTAWSAAGVAGPLIINAIADAETAAGKSGADLYTLSLYIMVGVLIVGFVANLLIRPVNDRFMEPEEHARRFRREPAPAEAATAERS